MKKNEKNKLIEEYSNGCLLLRKSIEKLSDEVLKYRPFPDAWTIKEHIIHTVDGEMNAFLRLKFLVAESGKNVIVINEEMWTKNLNYNNESIEDYLNLFDLIKKIASNFLKNLKDDIWESNFIMHPDFGKLTLNNWIKAYTKHTSDHINFIKRNIDLWNSERK